MPDATSLSINDSVPTAHTFAPQSVTPASTILVDRDTADTAAGYPQVILGLSPASSSRPTSRVNIRLNVPVEYTVDGVVKIAYVSRFNGDIILPQEMTQQERDDFAALLKNLLADTVVQGYITNLDPMY